MAKPKADARRWYGRSGEFWKVFGPAIVLTLAGFVLAYQFVEPAPPRSLTIATGGADGAYFAFAQRYREILARDGISLEIAETSGSVENLGLLQSGQAGQAGPEVAFVQGGTSDGAQTEDLRSLASLYFEPLWIFTRGAATLERLPRLAGRRLAIGAEGSGTRAVALQLLADNDLARPPTRLLPLGGMAAAEALLAGEVDAAFFVASPAAPVVRRLLEADEAGLMSLSRAEAYTRRYHFLSKLVLPEGVIDFERNLPPGDVALLAPTANLVAREALHPALIVLLLRAVAEVHGEGGLFEQPGEFPAARFIDFPLSDTARRYFKSGPPLLQRFLPFWAADLIDRLLILLLPLVTLLIPLLRIVPPAYRWRVRSRIYRWYRELQEVDDSLESLGSLEQVGRNLAELDRIESEVMQLTVPLAYADSLYHLRLHIDFVRAKLKESQAGRGG
jgi:TRAP transporter TAXI family solute receptor